MFVYFVLLHNDVLFEGIFSEGMGLKHNLKPRGPRPLSPALVITTETENTKTLPVLKINIIKIKEKVPSKLQLCL